MTRRLSALLLPLALAGCAAVSRGPADEGVRAHVAHGRDRPADPPEPRAAAHTHGNPDNQPISPYSAQDREERGFSYGHRVDDNVQPPPN